MLEDIRNEVKNTIAPLLGAIVSDTQTLVRQEIALAKSEVREEFSKARQAGLSFGISAALGILAVLFSGWTMAYFLGWLFPSLPLWTCFGLVAVAAGGGASALYSVAKKTARGVEVIPSQTVETMKENATWIKNRI